MSTSPTYPRRLPKLKGLPPNLYANVASTNFTVIEGGAPKRTKPTTAEVLQHKSAELQLSKKVDLVANVLDDYEAKIAANKDAIERLTACNKFLTRCKDRLENKALSRLGDADRAHGFEFELIAHTCPPALVVDDPTLIPAEYWYQPPIPEKEPAKTLIKTVLVRGSKKNATSADVAAAQAIHGVHLAQKITLKREKLS